MNITSNVVDNLTLTLEGLITLQQGALNNASTTAIQLESLSNSISAQIATVLTAQKAVIADAVKVPQAVVAAVVPVATPVPTQNTLQPGS